MPALTGLRFFLAAWVLLLHLSSLNTVVRGLVVAAHVGPWVNSGASAVGIFFLLSGFVLATGYPTLEAKSRFWAARLARVYPTYLVSLGIELAIFAAPLGHGHPAEWPSAGVVVENLLLLQAWDSKRAMLWSGAGWSLSGELFFYALFPAVLVALAGVGRRSLMWLFAAAWAVSLGVPPVLSMLGGWMDGGTLDRLVQLHPLVRLPEFLAGVLLAKLYPHIPSRFASAFTWTGLAGMAVTIPLVFRVSPGVLHNGALLPFSGALVIGLAMGGGWLGRQLSRPTVRLLGKASFALYLLQVPMYIILQAVFNRAHIPDTPGLWAACFVLCVIPISVAVHLWVEEPARAWLQPGRQPPVVAADPL